jgi:hypothetical protein
MNRRPLIFVTLFTAVVMASVHADDFPLAKLPSFAHNFDLTKASDSGKNTFYKFIHETLAPEMESLAPSAGQVPNQQALEQGLGVAVRLDDNNYNVHENFPKSAQGGRSYGWTSGQVGDWSDKMYLDNLARVIVEKDKNDLKNFYQTIIQLLGACDAHGLSALTNNYDDTAKTGFPTQRVATNFLAIYTAEEYRAIQGTKNWDDAILEVTLLGAFHGGQTTFTKFYRGEFTTQSNEQETGNYYGLPSKDKNGNVIPTVAKPAAMDDYWQISKTSTRSGIHLTAGDYGKMGVAITKYESAKPQNNSLSLIKSIVGSGPNVIESISRYFTEGKADPGKTNTLAAAIAQFLDQVNTDANEITASVKGAPFPQPSPTSPQASPTPPQASPTPTQASPTPPVALPKINGSVGRWDKGAVNKPADVSTVQRLLQTAAQKLNDRSLDPKGIDGKIAHVAANSHTVSAIRAFQTRSALEVTGLIKPGDETWTKLLAAAGETTP